MFKKITKLSLGLVSVSLLSCSGEKAFDNLSLTASQYKGYIVVSSVTTDPSTGPGIVSLFKPDGTYVTTLRDYFVSSNQWASGLSFAPPNEVLASIGQTGSSRIERINLSTGVVDTFYSGARISGNPNRNLVKTSDGSFFLAEYAAHTIEKFDKHGGYIGTPFINTATTTDANTCTLSNPWGLAVIPADATNPERLVAISYGAAGRLSVFNATDGSCITHTTAAPFDSGAPTAVAYHKGQNKILVTFSTTHTVWACDVNGTNCTRIWNTTGTTLNTPRAIAIDQEDNIYIGSSGTDTIYKLTWAGGANQMQFVGSGTLIGPSTFTNNPQAIGIIE